MILKVLHNVNCSKSNAVVNYLNDHQIEYEIINLVEDPLSVVELKTVLKKLNADVYSIIRKADKAYGDYAEKDLSEEEWLSILSQNPNLVQRPILVKGKVAILGRPLENVIQFIEN